MSESMIFLAIVVGIFIVSFIAAIIITTVKNIQVNRYSDTCGIGCIVRRTEYSKNPFDDDIIVEYEVVDKKFDNKGKCWVKLHRQRDGDLEYFDKTKRIEELYDKGYVIVYPKK